MIRTPRMGLHRLRFFGLRKIAQLVLHADPAELRCGFVSVSHSGPLARPSISSNCRANAVADTAHMRSAPPGGRGAIPMRVNNPCPGPFHARRAARARPAGPAAPDPVAGAARRIPPDAPRGVHQAGTRQWHRKTSFPKLGLGVDEVGSCC